MTVRALTIFSVFCCLATLRSAVAEVRHVPSEYPTLEAALTVGGGPFDPTFSGTIILAPGEHEADVTIRSFGSWTIQGSDPTNPDVVAATILNGGIRSSEYDVFISGNYRIRGLTMRGSVVVDDLNSGNTLTVSDCRFVGGAAGIAVSLPAQGSVLIHKNSFVDCDQAISSFGEFVHVTQCSFHRNLFAFSGFAQSFTGNSVCESYFDGVSLVDIGSLSEEDTIEIARNEFFDNFGGALSIGSTTHARVTDNFIVNNDSGVQMNGATEIRNCTIVGNRTFGAAISDESGDLVENSILYGNGVNVSAFGNANVTYCCLDTLLPGVGNIAADPEFADPAAMDYHLLDTSPCINAGPLAYDWGIGSFDSDGDLRVRRGRIDIGADETPYDAITGGGALHGDMNGDGVVNGLDVQGFVEALLGS